MKRHQELKTRILVLLLGGLALPVIVLAVAVVVLLMKFETTRRTEQNLTYVARSVVQQVDALLDRAAAAALASGIDGTIVSTLGSVMDSNQRQLRLSKHLDELAERCEIFDLIVVVHRTGYLLATNLKKPHPSRLDLSRGPQLCWGQDFTSMEREGPWIQQALKQGVSHPEVMKLNRGISPVAECLGVPRTIDDVESYFVRYATPLKDNQTVLGVIVFYLSWRLVQESILDKAAKELERAGYESGYAFMYDQDQRTLIGHPNRRLYNTDVVNTHHLDTLHEAVLRGQNSHTYEYPPGVAKIAGLARCSSPAGFGWTVGAGVNFPDIYGRVIWLGAGYATAVIVLALVASYFALRMTRQFRLSVDQLIQTAGRVARGEMPGTVNVQSQDEIGHLAEAFNEMAETLRKHFRASEEAMERPFREIRPNPYLFGNPIKNKEMFFGRRAEFALAREKLARAAGGVTLVFFGDRRSGKTSILYQLKNGELGNDFVTVFVDLQGLATVTSEEEFYESVAVEISEAVPAAKSSPIWPVGKGAKGFREFLHRILHSLRDKRLVILFDEYETIDVLINRDCLSAQVVLFLASLTEAEPPISFVLSGSRSIEQQLSPNWAALIPKSYAIEVGLLSREDALALIQNPLAGLVEFDFGIPIGIVRLTGGHPYYTQVVCQNLVDHLNRVRHNLCDARNLVAVVDEVLQNPPPQMLYFWKQLAIPEKITLSLLAEALGDEGSSATTVDLMARVAEYPVGEPITEYMLRQILDLFSAKRHLEEPEKGRFRFQLDLFRLWIRRAHSMWQVLREEAKTV
jgi:HAMP domain-containing protein